ncbi:MAG TPA: TetR family transcriptional regulator [Solirubrobacteraceae bacterium]|jgi:AcrR family transcriptional regulator|nr:TetR family transcriptional regulator [Solirubrobacteraceae bacterium]
MAIPGAASSEQAWTQVEPGREWGELGAEAKHERILCAAGSLFASHGLDAPMPAVAALAGAGVGSVYRQFPSKRELLAALVIRRLEQIRAAADEAAMQESDHWQALTDMMWKLLEQQAADDFLGQAWSQVEEHEQVQVAATASRAALDRLISLARVEGSVREDASALDIRLMFVAAQASRQVGPDAWQRVFALMLDGLVATRP